MANQFDYKQRDNDDWDTLGDLFDANDFTYEDVLGNCASYVRRKGMVRFIAQYELFKHVIDLPGCIPDAGVFRGSSLFTWAKLMETFCPGDRSRKIFAFDHFDGLQGCHDKDGAADAATDKVVGGYRSSLENIETLIELHHSDGFLPGVERIKQVNGDIQQALPQFWSSQKQS